MIQKLSLPADGAAFIGIDPGASGGLACLGTRKQLGNVVRWDYASMPETELDILSWFQAQRKQFGEIRAAIERVHAMPGNGVVGMFRFGWSYGSLRMALLAAEIPFIEVTPGTWQKCFGMKKSRDEKKSFWKNRLKAKAQQEFPHLEKITLATADALLIAEYLRLRTFKRV